MSCPFEDVYESRDEACRVLDNVKRRREKMKTRIVRVNAYTWIEKNVIPQEKQETMMKNVSREDAENAIALYRAAKTAKMKFENQMAEAERTVEAFGRQHLDEFVEGRLALDSGTLAIWAGSAKPLKEGRPLSTADRKALASMLPEPYVRLSCDFGELFACHDKMVRQILKQQGVEVVRDDKIVVM